MIIGRSNYALTAASMRQVEQTRSERLRTWDDRGGQQTTEAVGSSGQAGSSTLEASARNAARAHARQVPSPRVPAPLPDPVTQTTAPLDNSAAADGDETNLPAAYDRFTVLIALVEKLTGRKIQIYDPSDFSGTGQPVEQVQDPRSGAAAPRSGAAASGTAAAQTRQGWGVDYERIDTRVESQHTEFSAAGRVTTTDGREINFAVDLRMDRESVQVSNLRFQAGDSGKAAPAVVDPLVLNFGGGSVGLTASKIDFDLNADGRSESISFVSGSNGFLVLDRNGNGAVDDGRELFGPSTGSGFAELAAFDDDGNGWIDSGDAVYSQLRVWDEAGGPLKTLAERGVGAIALGNVATPFDLEAAGETAGAVRATGIWLGEDGTVGTVHHVDLAM